MNSTDIQEAQQKRTYEFVANVFGMTGEESGQPTEALPVGVEFSAATPRRNQPEFWADAPWRVEPDGDLLPVSFIIRDGDVQPPGKGPWRLDLLKVEQRLADGNWHQVCAFTPADLPDVDEQGYLGQSFWRYSVEIPLGESESGCRLKLSEVVRGGDPLHLRAVFVGGFPPFDEIEAPEIHLEVQLAEQGLPQGRAAHGTEARHWFHGDTHYHSSYTNDVKEFGGPVRETREAGRAIGLDWLVITDHSCDLDETDGDASGATRWERLKAEVSSADLSNEQFRCILGEEITLRGGNGERYVHMLAFGEMEDMVEGGFLPDQEGGFMTRLFKETIEELLEMAIREGGYAPDTGEHLFGPVHTFAEVLDALPQQTLTFAAHPYTIAQPPFINCDWAQEDLDDLRLAGHEFWNGRHRRSALLTDDPFSSSGWTDLGNLEARDKARIKKLKREVEGGWDAALKRGVRQWLPSEHLPARRPVFVAGSDAHGSFNYSVGWGWDYEKQFQINDNALGRVRTAIHLPEHGTAAVPEVADILAALRKGACVVTDGPLIEYAVAHEGNTAHMGDLLPIASGGEAEMEIVAHTTAEFGNVEEVEVITYFRDPAGDSGGGGFWPSIAAFWQNLWGDRARKTVVKAGDSRTIRLAGSQGFCRVQARTVGSRGEHFCCFTNPIWLRITEGRQARMRVHLAP